MNEKEQTVSTEQTVNTATELKFKNIQQIGSGDDGNRIYIEQNAYDRIYQEEAEERRVFLLMGHTECLDGHYTTYVEAAIPIREISYVQNIPQWDNHVWSLAFQEIKRAYEDTIIVGWAFDRKGVSPKINKELEALHREQFGGIHQVFFLLDTIEKEDYFYINKKNHLRQKQGYYIYGAEVKVQQEDPVNVEVELPPDAIFKSRKSEETKSPRYRQAIHTATENSSVRYRGLYAMATIIAVLVGVVGIGAYRTRNQMVNLQNELAVMATQKETVQNSNVPESSVEIEKVQGFLTEDSGTTETDSAVMEQPSDQQNLEQKDSNQQNSEQQGQGQQGTLTQNSNQVGQGAAPTEEPVAEEQPVVQKEFETYVIQKKDTLYSICRKRYGDLEQLDEICQLNDISNPDEIYEGQTIKLP